MRMPLESGQYSRNQDSLCLPHPRLAELSFSCGTSKVTALSDEELYRATGTRIAFTARTGGSSAKPFESLNLSLNVQDDIGSVMRNRSLVLEAFGARLSAESLVVPNQVHGDIVLALDNDVEGVRSAAEVGADGIVCARDEVPVLLCFADCVPVISVAPNGMFSIVHAGWRGSLASIPEIGLRRLSEVSGYDACDCNSYIGPHIGACCYEVGGELLRRFIDEFGSGCDAGEGRLDLSYAVVASLLRAGGDLARIEDCAQCTSCNTQRYFSHRAEQGETGRHGAFAYKEAQ